ncbi:hypothetical protein BDQ17DRAFT_1420558 [Cyathus striatus]|nr:hypothetical protein BDQ17DRAFT_1420558 [Cyathus striatus]
MVKYSSPVATLPKISTLSTCISSASILNVKYAPAFTFHLSFQYHCYIRESQHHHNHYDLYVLTYSTSARSARLPPTSTTTPVPAPHNPWNLYAPGPPKAHARTLPASKLTKSGGGGGGGKPIPRDARKSRVDDKIKKRMSMRYAEISSPTELNGNGLPAMPDMAPFMPAQGGGVMTQEGEDDVKEREKDGVRVIGPEDKKAMSAEDFDPDAFVKQKLANSTEAELKSLQSSLSNAKNDTASELQRSVFKNYAEFVLISKEISVLENEMLELKDLLSDYKSMPSTLYIPDPTAISSSTLSTYKRSSIADLKILYFNQMQELHASIEGAAKFIPTTPGRHVVSEMEGILSLNAATYKVVGKVKFVILDDSVLVARRRRRNAGGDGGGSTVNEGKLVAEKCWPLNEMLVLDTKDSSNMTNVFKIRHGKETHVYRTQSSADKKVLLAQFRVVAEELSTKRRREREGEHERRKSMWQAGAGERGSIPPVPDWMAELVKKGADLPGMGSDEKDKADKDARWVSEWSDDLTVAIALREWTRAVELIEKGEAKLSTTPPLSAKLITLKNELTSALLTNLSLHSNRKSTVVTLIMLLNRLGAGAAARSAFLDMRKQVIHGLMRKIQFTGDVCAYIGELAVVFFTGIRHTADWYLASFKENEVASTFTTWAQSQIEKYAETYRKQVFSKDVDSKMVEEANQITRLQSKKLLEEYGLDFRFLLNAILVQHPKVPDDPVVKFSLQDHRMSKQIQPSTQKLIKHVEIVSPQLPPAPPPPTISAPPLSRRRGPGPSSDSTSPPRQGAWGSLQPPPSAGLQPPSSAGGRTPLSPHSPASVYTNETTPVANSARPPYTSGPYTSGYPASAINRSRTPVSAAVGNNTTPLSAPIPGAPLPSPLPRRVKSPPLSANPYRPPTAPGARDRESDGEFQRAKERPPRSHRGSPAPRSPAPPPRSANRPGVPPREGMI